MIANRLLKNFLSLSAAGIVHSVVAVATTVYLARILGPEGFGIVNFSFAFVQYFLIVSAFGLDIVGVRSVARDKESVKQYVGNIMAIKLTVSIVLFLLLCAIVPFIGRTMEANRIMIMYGIVLFPTALFFEWTWQGLERMGNIGVSKIIRQLLYLVGILLLVRERNYAYLVPVIFLIVNSLYAIILYTLFVKNYGPVRLSFDFSAWRSLASQSAPIALSQILAVMVYTLSPVMLGFMRSNAEVGLYSAAFQIVSFVSVFLSIYFDTIFPTISNLYLTSIEKMERVLAFSGKTLLTVTIPMAVGGTILAGPIMQMFFGEKYMKGTIALQLLIWSIVLIVINSVYARGLLAVNMQNYHVKVVSLQVTVNFILNLLLIPYLGVSGTVLASLSAEITGLYLYYRGFRRIGNVNLHGSYVKPILAALVMGLFIIPLINWNLIVVLPFAVIVYFTVLVLLKGLDYSELRWAADLIAGKGNKAAL